MKIIVSVCLALLVVSGALFGIFTGGGVSADEGSTVTVTSTSTSTQTVTPTEVVQATPQYVWIIIIAGIVIIAVLAFLILRPKKK